MTPAVRQAKADAEDRVAVEAGKGEAAKAEAVAARAAGVVAARVVVVAPGADDVAQVAEDAVDVVAVASAAVRADIHCVPGLTAWLPVAEAS